MPVSLKTQNLIYFSSRKPREIPLRFQKNIQLGSVEFLKDYIYRDSHFFDQFFLIGMATSKLLSQFYIVCTHRLPLRRPQQPLPIRLRFLIWQQKNHFQI